MKEERSEDEADATQSEQPLRVGLPLLLTGAALFGFSLLDLQKCSDIIPLLPYLAFGATALLWSGTVIFGVFLDRVSTARTLSRENLIRVLASPVLVLVLAAGQYDAFSIGHPTGLTEQRSMVNRLAAQLEPGDRVQQFGDAVLLVLLNRENATRFVHLGEKQGRGILTAEGLSVEQLVDQVRAADPRLITLSRAKSKDWAEPFYLWLDANYTLSESYSSAAGGTQRDTDVYWKK